jgi:hypothetical protein
MAEQCAVSCPIVQHGVGSTKVTTTARPGPDAKGPRRAGVVDLVRRALRDVVLVSTEVEDLAGREQCRMHGQDLGVAAQHDPPRGPESAPRVAAARPPCPGCWPRPVRRSHRDRAGPPLPAPTAPRYGACGCLDGDDRMTAPVASAGFRGRGRPASVDLGPGHWSVT